MSTKVQVQSLISTLKKAEKMENLLRIRITKGPNEDYGFGLVFEELPIIQTILANSPATSSPLKVGDVIYCVNNNSVKGVEPNQVLKWIKAEQSSVLFEVRRNNLESDSDSTDSDDSSKSNEAQLENSSGAETTSDDLAHNTDEPESIIMEVPEITVEDVEDEPIENKNEQVNNLVKMTSVECLPAVPDETIMHEQFRLLQALSKSSSS